VSDDETPRSFLLLCDERLKEKVDDLLVSLDNNESGDITIATIEEVPEGRLHKGNFGEQLQTMLDSCHAVVLVSSENLSSFIDENRIDNLPTILRENHDVSQRKLCNFFEDQMRNTRPKIISVSVDGDTTLPNILNGRLETLVKEENDEEGFVQELRGRMAALMNR